MPQLEMWSTEKEPVVLVDTKLSMSQQLPLQQRSTASQCAFGRTLTEGEMTEAGCVGP